MMSLFPTGMRLPQRRTYLMPHACYDLTVHPSCPLPLVPQLTARAAMRKWKESWKGHPPTDTGLQEEDDLPRLYPKAVDKFPNPSPVVRNLGTCLLFHGLGLDPFSSRARMKEEGNRRRAKEPVTCRPASSSARVRAQARARRLDPNVF